MFEEEVDVATAAFHTHGLDVASGALLLTVDFTQRQWRREIDTRIKSHQLGRFEGDDDAKEDKLEKENEPEFVQWATMSVTLLKSHGVQLR